MESKSIRKIIVFFISIPHFVFCILQECSFKSVKYELTHSEVWNINCNQCKYVRASAFSHFFANYDLWIPICWQMGRSVTAMQEKRKTRCASHKSRRRDGFQGRELQKCHFLGILASPPKYIAHLSGNIDSLLIMGWKQYSEKDSGLNQPPISKSWYSYLTFAEFCNKFWSEFLSEFYIAGLDQSFDQQQQHRRHCGSQLEGFGPGTKVRPLTGHHHLPDQDAFGL